MWEDPSAGPFLQAMIFSVTGESDALDALLPVLLGAGPGSTSDHKHNHESVSLEGVPVDLRVALLEGKGGSRLMEAALKVAHADMLAEIYTRFFRTRMAQLSAHPIANFVVQSFLSATKEPAQVRMVLAELEPEMGSLLKQRRGGVVAALVAATGRLGSAQKEACKALARAVTVCGAEEEAAAAAAYKAVVPVLLTLEARGAMGSQFDALAAVLRLKPLSTLGCAILKVVMSYPAECLQLFADSLTSLPEEHTVCVASDPGGAHVIESFVEGNAPLGMKKRLLSKLKSHFAEIAMSGGAGVRLVETCYKWGDMGIKEVVAAELMPIEKELAKSKTGTFLLQRCGLTELKKQPEQWKAKESTRTKMRDEFRQMFSDRNNGPAMEVAASASTAKGEKRGAQHETKLRAEESAVKKDATSNSKGKVKTGDGHASATSVPKTPKAGKKAKPNPTPSKTPLARAAAALQAAELAAHASQKKSKTMKKNERRKRKRQEGGVGGDGAHAAANVPKQPATPASAECAPSSAASTPPKKHQGIHHQNTQRTPKTHNKDKLQSTEVMLESFLSASGPNKRRKGKK
eukprot:CAMPEP_0114293662 /NCGR_PEP_ID=MMETSP0059-20121206/9714_1 /TAXON_ID=36894 /ORGANISM="Pyramimonas parkeae, Strain CCMP726" /LENGTH=574 /DNA_ID=CAMNT_0001415391 /DNA_START=15 /DNA_END=1739 /DNA_ORIENTATION=+